MHSSGRVSPFFFFADGLVDNARFLPEPFKCALDRWVFSFVEEVLVLDKDDGKNAIELDRSRRVIVGLCERRASSVILSPCRPRFLAGVDFADFLLDEGETVMLVWFSVTSVSVSHVTSCCWELLVASSAAAFLRGRPTK